MIRAGLVGLGKMGISHCAILNAHADIDLVGACDSSRFLLNFMNKYSTIKCFTDYREMIDSSDLDCIVIATPTRFHSEMATYALERKLHTFLEKPFALNVTEGKKMVALVNENNLVSQVGYHNRFLGTFRKIKELISAGVIGEVYHFLGEAYGPVVLRQKSGSWRSDSSEGGGCLYDYASHVINLIQFLLGDPERVAGTIKKSIFSSSVDDAIYSSIFLTNGISGQLSVNWSDETYRKMSTQISILGKRGKIIADAQECKIFLRDNHPEHGLVAGWNMRYLTDLSDNVQYYLRGEEYSSQIDYFAQCIKQNWTDNINSFAAAHKTDEIIQLLIADAKTGAMIHG